LIDGEPDGPWTIRRCGDVLNETLTYWQGWVDHLTYTGPRSDWVRRAAVTVHLLGDAPAGSLVAAPTTSLPERIGGGWNADYRFTWVRDASLSVAALALLGDTETARRYIDWVCGLGSATEAPLQVVYRIDGGTDLSQTERRELHGFRGSQPVRVGNHAYLQHQLGSFGYFADCALIYLEQGGTWREEYWQMVCRAADYTAAVWHRPDNGIWELPSVQHYVSSKVMSWVTLERTVKIAERLGRPEKVAHWRAVMAEIHAEVMRRGWSEHLHAFRQRYGTDTLDASALLIPVMGFLPADHPRVAATVARIASCLTLNGYVYRFHPGETPGVEHLPLGEFEGAFLPCTCWLATAYAKAGRLEAAEVVLARVEHLADELGLLAEGVDARSGTFLGNFPLLFSQIEYIRAVMELAKT
jgi:GH15 family glucan-1,4-alpha-glucosidase